MSWISDNVIDLGSKKKEVLPTKKPVQSLHTHEDTVFVDSSGTGSQYNPTTDYIPSNSLSANDLTDFRKHFSDLITQNNIPGNDYYEFVATKNAMSSIPVEEQRYTIAFAGLSAAGLTKEIINNSASKYMNLIDRELQDFQSAFGQQFKQQVTDIKSSIEAKQKQMLDLSAQISKLNEEIKATADAANLAESSLTAKANSFQKAGNEAKQTITDELNKINQFIN